MDSLQDLAADKAESIRIWAGVCMALGLIGSAFGIFYGVNLLIQSNSSASNESMDIGTALLNVQILTGTIAIVCSLFAATTSVLQFHFFTGFSYLLELANFSSEEEEEEEEPENSASAKNLTKGKK